MRSFLVALLFAAPHAIAGTLVTNTNGHVTGINELTVNLGAGDANYDITLTADSYDNVYGTNTPYFEGNADDAEAFILAILDLLNASNRADISDETYDGIFIPFDREGGCTDATDMRVEQIGLSDNDGWVRYGNFCGGRDTVSARYHFAQISRSANQPSTPVPALPALNLLLLAVGVIALGSLRRRKIR